MLTTTEFKALLEAPAGAVEHTFGLAGRDYSDHGVAVVELREGRIAFWREYQRKGPPEFAEFIAVEGKEWQSRGDSLLES